MSVKIINTADGSNTLLNTVLNEFYHSIHGAIQESQHVYIESGFKEVAGIKKDIFVFEMGFGTGLNAFLTALAAEELDIRVKYLTIDTDPLPFSVIENLNYTKLPVYKFRNQLFFDLHTSQWGQEIRLSDKFIIKKVESGIESFEIQDTFDLIYFDAFGPEIQPEIWTEKIFVRMYNALKVRGRLLTYCAKGSVKRAMKASGFNIENIAGPPGKMEITRAEKL